MRFEGFAAVGSAVLLIFPTAANAGCAGLSSSAISAKFSEARQSCSTAASSAPAPAGIVVVPQVFELPRSVAVSYSALAPQPAKSRRTTRGNASGLLAVSRAYRIDPLLLHSIVARESAFRTDAVSHKGALGLMQIMPGTARGLGVRDPSRLLTDPDLNLITGATYLKQLQGQFGNNVPAVLAAYNAGPGAVRKYRGTPPYRETRAYVKTIMARYRSAREGGSR